MSELNNSSQGKPFNSYLLNRSGDIAVAHLKGMWYSNKDKIGESATKPVTLLVTGRLDGHNGNTVIDREGMT